MDGYFLAFIHNLVTQFHTMSGKSIVALGLCHLLADVGKELLVGTSLAGEVGKCVKCLWNGLTCCGSHAVLNGLGFLAQITYLLLYSLDVRNTTV